MNKKLLAACAFLALPLMNCMESGGTDPQTAQNQGNTEAGGAAKGRPENVPHVDQEVFVKSSDLTLEKGAVIPKGTFILKSDETEEGYKRSSSGPWTFSALEKTATADRRYISTTGEYHRIYLVAGTSTVACPSGSTKMSLDLNRGAGGKYIYMCGSESGSGSILPSSIYIIDKSSAAPPVSDTKGFLGVNGSNSDMNQGAGGDYVYGRYEIGGSCPVDGIGVEFADHWWEPLPLPFTDWYDLRGGRTYDADMNDGAGGASIFFMFRTRNQCWQ